MFELNCEEYVKWNITLIQTGKFFFIIFETVCSDGVDKVELKTFPSRSQDIAF